MNKKIYYSSNFTSVKYWWCERGVVEISKALVENNFRSIVISSGGHMVSQIIEMGNPYELDVATKNP